MSLITLPNDLQRSIIVNLSAKDITALSKTCKTYQSLLNDQENYKILLNIRFKKQLALMPTCAPKGQYLSLCKAVLYHREIRLKKNPDTNIAAKCIAYLYKRFF